MDGFLGAVLTASWLGILTSISPCPLTTNIAAISFISKNVESRKLIFLNGLLYTLGRMAAYTLIAFAIVASLLNIPDIARFLQEYINIALGPILIIIGLILLNVLRITFSGGGGMSERLSKKASGLGHWGALFIGVLFALSFCPVSAGLFFGSLIPLSLREGSGIILPLIFGIGTALPVIVFAFIIAFSASKIGEAFNKVRRFQYWANRITGIVFILAGLYMSWQYIL